MENVNDKIIIHIPDNLQGTDLLSFLYPSHFSTDSEKKAAHLLHKICFASLTDFRPNNYIKDLKITDEEKDIIISQKWNESNNKEVKARCSDLLCNFEKDKRKIVASTSDCYLDTYNEFGGVEFLIRAVTARNIKSLNDSHFLNRILTTKSENIHPHWLNKLVFALLKSYSVEQLNPILPIVKEQRNKSVTETDYRKERQYIDVLYSLKNINSDEYCKQMALSFENEADNIAANKQPYTFYPNLPDIYQDAYNTIFKIKDKEPQIHERIKTKLVEEKKIFIELLSLNGVKMEMDVSEDFKLHIDESTQKLTIKYLDDAITLLLSIPLPSVAEVEKYVGICRKASPMGSIFGHSQLNSKGYIVGKSDCEISLQTEAHIYCRQKRLYALWSYLHLIKWSNIDLHSDLMYAALQQNKPDFIDEDNLIIWEKGITAGFNKDFITASHILMPQLEHALHNIAEIHKGTITSLEKQRQEEPTLGKTLPMLDEVIEKETLFELKSFLVGGIDVNFRNNLLHGLFTPFEINKYGIYLWWLCLRVYFSKNIYIAHETKNNPQCL